MKSKLFKTGHLQIVGVVIFILLSIFLYSSTQSLKSSIDTSILGQVRSDVVRMKLYEGVTSSEFEGKNTLSYSFRIPENASVVTALSGKLLAVTQNTKMLGRVFFSYEGGRGYSEYDYIKNSIEKATKDVSETFVETIDGKTFVSVVVDGDIYLVTKLKNGEWLAVFQAGEKGKEELKQIISTFEVHP